MVWCLGYLLVLRAKRARKIFKKFNMSYKKAWHLPFPRRQKKKKLKNQLLIKGVPLKNTPLTHIKHLAIIPSSPSPLGGDSHERMKPCNPSSYNQKVPIRCSVFYIFILCNCHNGMYSSARACAVWGLSNNLLTKQITPAIFIFSE